MYINKNYYSSILINSGITTDVNTIHSTAIFDAIIGSLHK